MLADDDLTKTTSCSRSKLLKECLVRERSKGLEMLQGKSDKNAKESSAPISTNYTKSQQDALKIPLGKATIAHGKRSPVNKENIRQNSKTCQSSSIESRLSDYVPYRHREAVDISDLITNASITLENTPRSVSRDTDVSFHPAEMTGRSTLHKHDSKSQRTVARSVDEILASSFVDNVREMRNSLAGFGSNILGIDRLSTASSCISGFSAMQKNPRPTTISENKSMNLNDSNAANFKSNSDHSFGANGINISVSSEDFAPAEMMESRILQDEINWAYERACMPTAVLSEEARRKLASCSSSANHINQSSASNSISFSDPNFSLGHFFTKHSNNLTDILQNKTRQDKERAPKALISNDTMTTTTTTPMKSLSNSELSTPVIDDKNYSRATKGGDDTLTLKKTTQHTTPVAEPHDSKDSGNASSKSDLLSLSEIDRVLENWQLATDNSALRVVNEMVSKGRKSKKSNDKSNALTVSEAPHKLSTTEPKDGVDLVIAATDLNNIADILSENKENIELQSRSSITMADTLSFTESLLNTSINNYRMSSAGQARLPLSPIPIMITESTSDNTENDADVDEFANSPVVSSQRRKRFSKSSPRSSSLNSHLTADVKIIETDEADREKPQQTPTKAGLTRLNGDQSSPAGTGVDVSSNIPKNTATLTPTYHGNNSSNTNAFDFSPLSSPCSYPSSAANSPVNNGRNRENRGATSNRVINKNCHCSPQFDTTTNSEFRYLNVFSSASNGGLRRVASSPSQSEASTAIDSKQSSSISTIHCGAPPVRTYSSNSVRSTGSTRSTSRCSNNSEFTHRDGKGMPLKATALEISWASIKLRTDSHKSIQVKNTSNKRLVVRIEISGPGFQLISPESNMLTIQSQECRTIVVNYYPTTIGTAIGRLVFQPPKSLNSNNSNAGNANLNPNNEIIIPLYAYGGNASITIQNLLKGPVGGPFLPMGEFCTLIRPLERSFEIYNKGPLMGFAAIYIEPIGLHVPEISNSFEVYPECTLIESNTAVTIRLVFQPNLSDLRKIRKICNDVLTLAKLRIVYGDEAIRQRLRQIQRNMDSVARENFFTRSLDKLWNRFPGEQMLFSPMVFKDSASVAQDMWACISEQEVALTLNNNMLDETAAELSTIFKDADNDILFRTVCVSSPTNQLETVDELVEETHVHNTPRCIASNSAVDEGAVSSTSTACELDLTGTNAVTPEYIEIDCNNRQELTLKTSTLRVRNYCNKRQYFQIVCNHRNFFRFVPSDGYVQANGIEFPIELYLHPDAESQEIPHNITIMVYMENKKYIVPVHVPSTNQ